MDVDWGSIYNGCKYQEMQPKCADVEKLYNRAQCCEAENGLVDVCSADTTWNGEECAPGWVTMVAIVVAVVFCVLFVVMLFLYRSQRATPVPPTSLRRLKPAPSINRFRLETCNQHELHHANHHLQSTFPSRRPFKEEHREGN